MIAAMVTGTGYGRPSRPAPDLPILLWPADLVLSASWVDAMDRRLYTLPTMAVGRVKTPPALPGAEPVFMNTYRIYEDLRSSLGEEAARSLAHTLGPMFEELGKTVTKAEFQELNATLGRLAEAQERTEGKVAQLAEGQADLTVAQARTGTQVAELTQAQTRTGTQVAELTQAQTRTEAQVAELAQAQARTETQVVQLTLAQTRTEAQVAELTLAQTRTEAQVTELTLAQTRTESQVIKLTQAQTRTEVQLAALTQVAQSLVVEGGRQATRLDAVLGRTFEIQFRDRLTSYLGRLMRRGKLLRNDEVLEAIEQAVDAGEADEVLRADAIATGVIDGVTSHVVVEVSITCDTDDIDRAARRAGILQQAGLVAVPLVACEACSRESLAYARSRQVRVWCNGVILDAAA
jgi:hypothetical protein